MNSLLFVNLLIVLSIIFRFLAIKISHVLIASGDYVEGNPISRVLLRSKGGLYICNAIVFVFIIVFFNIVVLSYKGSSIIVIAISIIFVIAFLDFLHDYYVLKNEKMLRVDI